MRDVKFQSIIGHADQHWYFSHTDDVKKSKWAERFKAVSVTINSSSAVSKYRIAYEIGDLMRSEIWRVDQISDIAEYSPKKKTEWAITFPHNFSSHSHVYPG